MVTTQAMLDFIEEEAEKDKEVSTRRMVELLKEQFNLTDEEAKRVIYTWRDDGMESY